MLQSSDDNLGDAGRPLWAEGEIPALPWSAGLPLERVSLQAELGRLKAELVRLRAELLSSRVGESRARHLALHDSLTALPNRRHFCLSLEQAIDQLSADRPVPALALLYVDLDGFKAINDSHGHAAGDELLAIVAVRLARALRGDDVVGRLGGDEFGCLLRGVSDRPSLRRLACKVFDAISAPIKVGDLFVGVRPSVGIAVFHADGGSAEGFLHAADQAMYQAKREQTGYAFFESPLDTARQRIRSSGS
jgi:diguanylate cyclase (GGDEF)-like protein